MLQIQNSTNLNTTLNESIDFKIGLEEKHLESAIKLYYQVFRSKMNTIIGERKTGQEILKKDIQKDRAITAYNKQELVGVVGLQYEGKSFMSLETFTFIFEQGLLSGLFHSFLYQIFSRPMKEGEMYLEGLAVKYDYRGLRIGTQLMELVFSLAKKKKVEEIKLDVINTNFKAKRFYENLGFEIIKENKVKLFKNQLGYSSFFTMRKKIKLINVYKLS